MTKGEQARLTAWRWKVLQQAADELNVARVCRHFGISRKSFYKWKRRHADHGAAGLCDLPRTPHRSPRATSRDVIRKILYRRKQYHFGPGRPRIASVSSNPRRTIAGPTASTGTWRRAQGSTGVRPSLSQACSSRLSATSRAHGYLFRARLSLHRPGGRRPLLDGTEQSEDKGR